MFNSYNSLFLILRELLPLSESKDTTLLLSGELIEEISLNRTKIDHIDEVALIENFNKLLYQFDHFHYGIEDDDIYRLPNRFMGVKLVEEVTIEEALSDVDHLFTLLKFAYGAYQYFGGDEIFLSAKADIVAEINKLDESIRVSDLNNILVKYLNFIQDGHFIVGEKRLFNRYQYFSSEKYAFSKDEEGYYTLIGNEKYYLVHVNEGDIDDYLYLTLNEEGEVVYNLGKLYSPNLLYRKIDIELKGQGAIINERIDLHLVHVKQNFLRIYAYSEKEGIPVVEIRKMFSDTDYELNQLNQFVESGKILRDRDFLILDIRGNMGGSDQYPARWIENYTRNTPSGDVIASHLYTDITVNATMGFLQTIKDEELRKGEEDKIRRVLEADYYPGWSPVNYQLPRNIANSNIVFVLIDGDVYSSGETFVRMLRQVENVVFVGVNTGGATLVGNMMGFMLPHSRLSLNFGRTLILPSDLKDLEGIGYQPDLWVSPDEALERIIKYISRLAPSSR
ncbi:S41 family peptidase [Alkaliphilus transvaalensis]|uniref:S41 family peptidase n=1 Tax=Alkaliphilus transvaalensis TaxID=114628 RepID=UPI00047AA378|nr:S41 family peptidase [Alkaliphilus transvaalensis]